MDRLTSMTAFVRTAELGSFAAAAAGLGISPQMAARHVAVLEARLGLRLLNRTTRRQSLTDVGRTYLERCRLVLSDLEAADSVAEEARAEPRGRLRITAPATFGSHRLSPMIARYLQRHPAVEIDLTLTDRVVDLIEEGFELAFRVGPLPDSGLVGRALAPYRLMACASPGYLRAHGTPDVPAELVHHQCLGYAYWSRPAETRWPFSRDNRTDAVAVRGRLRINDATALIAAAIGGGGIVLAPADAMADALRSGALVRLFAGFEPPTRPMHLLFPPDRRQTAKLRSFIDAAVREFGPASGPAPGYVDDRAGGRLPRND